MCYRQKRGEFYIGRTEYDSPDVDNEVLVDAKKKLYENWRLFQS